MSGLITFTLDSPKSLFVISILEFTGDLSLRSKIRLKVVESDIEVQLPEMA